MFDEQLQKALKRTEKRKSIPAEVEKMSPRRRQNIKSERRFSCDNEISIQVNDEMMRVDDDDDDDTLLQSDGGDESNENTANYSDMVDYVPTEEDELEEDDDDDDDEYELPKSRRRKNDKKDAEINETSYTVLESGDIALTTELVDIGEFPGSEGNCTHLHSLTHSHSTR